MPHFGMQAHDGERLLPRLVVSAEQLHDAEGVYCEQFGLDRKDIHCMGKPSIAGVPYWIETQETYEEHIDVGW